MLADHQASAVLGLQTHVPPHLASVFFFFLKSLLSSRLEGMNFTDQAVSSATPSCPRPALFSPDNFCSFPSHGGVSTRKDILRDPFNPKVEHLPESNFPHVW